MFKVTHSGNGLYVIRHYATGDLNPTPTERECWGTPIAWEQAFGRAAKMALMLSRPETVEMYDGRTFVITVEEMK